MTFNADGALGEDTLVAIGDAAAGVSAPIEEVATWFGRLYTGLEAGRPIGEAAARLQELGLLSGTARNELEDLAKEGGNVKAAMDLLLGEWGKHDGAMVALSTTTAGLESTFGDLIGQFAGAVSEVIGADAAYRAFLATSNDVLSTTTDLINGTETLDSKIEDLQAQVDLGGWGGVTGDMILYNDEMAELEAQLIDLKNQRFWEEFNTDLEAAAAAAAPIPETIVPAWEAAGFKSAEAYAKELAKIEAEAIKEAEKAAKAFWDAAEARVKEVHCHVAICSQAAGDASADSAGWKRCRAGVVNGVHAWSGRRHDDDTAGHDDAGR